MIFFLFPAAAAAWKTNPIFDDAWPEKQAAPEAHLVPSPAAPSPPKTNIAATTRTAATPSPTLTPPPQTTATVHPSLSAQARKLAEKVLKERADVSSKATAAHVVEAAHAAEDVDFPALEGSPPRVDSAGSGEDELVPGQVASKDAAEEEMRKREEGMPEVMEGPSEVSRFD